MAKPFQITLIPGAKAPTTKPGWHRRALAADRRHKPTTAPQRGNPDADAKAVTYALWLAARDGIAIPGDGSVSRVDWQPCAHGVRPRAVEWMPAPKPYRPAARGMAQPPVEPLLRIELPHWDYEAPAVIESTLLDWAAPVVIEAPREPAPVEAPAPCAPGGETLAPAPHPVEPQAVSAGGGGRDPHPPEGIQPAYSEALSIPLHSAIADPLDAIGEARTVTAVCLSHRARAHLLRRVGAVPPVAGYAAKGGAFALTLAEARSAADLKCVRLIGMPRKAYTRAVAPSPTPPVGIQRPTPPEAIPSRSWPVAWGYSIAGHARTSPVLHAAPNL